MYAAALLVASALAATFAARAPVRWGFALVLAAAVLVPAPLVVPNGFTGVLTVDRVLLVAFVVGLLVRARRAELPGPVRPFAATPVHLAFAGFLTVAAVLGLGTAVATTSTGAAGGELLDFTEQLVFFVAALAAIRVIGDTRWVLRLIAGVLIASAVIALAERVTGHSFGHAVFSHLPSQQGAGPPLETRLGHVRVRAGAEFALEFAWASIALLPVLIVAVGRLPRRALAVAPVAIGLPLLTVYWSYSRSALVGLAVGALVLVLGSRDRRAAGLTGTAALGLAATALAVPSLLAVYTLGADAGSVAVRGQRLPQIFALVADRPLRGLGLSGLVPFGFPVTDSSYLKVYAELGVIGLAAFALLLLTAVVCTSRGLLAIDPIDRRPAAAALAGVVVLLVAAVVFDALTLLGSARLLWLLAALGIATAERARGPLPRVGWLSVPRLLLPIGAVAVGLVLAAAWPTHTARSYVFSTLPTLREVGGYDPVGPGHALIDTACGVVKAVPLAGAHVDCVDTFLGAGIGRLRVQASSPAAVQQAVLTLFTAVRRTGIELKLSTAPVEATGPPTAIGTAPAWLGVLAFGAAVLVPGRRTQASPSDPRPRAATPVVVARRGSPNGWSALTRTGAASGQR